MSASLFRTRVAVLWLGVAVAAAGSVLLYLMVPGALEEMVAGEMEGEPLDDAVGFFMASLIAIPLVMSALALLVQGRANRYLNLSVGSLFALFVVYAVGSHLSAGDFNAHVLMAALGGVLAFVTVGLSIGGLRRPGPQATPARSEPAAVSERIPACRGCRPLSDASPWWSRRCWLWPIDAGLDRSTAHLYGASWSAHHPAALRPRITSGERADHRDLLRSAVRRPGGSTLQRVHGRLIAENLLTRRAERPVGRWRECDPTQTGDRRPAWLGGLGETERECVVRGCHGFIVRHDGR